MNEGASIPELERRRLEPPRGATLIALILALCFLAGAAGFNLGRGRPPGRSSADVGFLYDMIHHHQQAILMSSTELFGGETTDVKKFAEEILRFQSYEVGLMARILNEWGYSVQDPPARAMAWMDHPTAPDNMPGMATPSELRRLSDLQGRARDELFLALMADHHAGAVEMAETAARDADDAEVKDLAARMAKTQRFEIKELIAAADRARLDRTPTGMTADIYDPRTGEVVASSEHYPS